jgi:hypothetical protein
MLTCPWPTPPLTVMTAWQMSATRYIPINRYLWGTGVAGISFHSFSGDKASKVPPQKDCGFVGAGISVPAGWDIQGRGNQETVLMTATSQAQARKWACSGGGQGKGSWRRMLRLMIRRPRPKLARWRLHDSLCGTPLSLSSEAGPGEWCPVWMP